MARLVRRVGASVWRWFGGPWLARKAWSVRYRRPTPPATALVGDDARRFKDAMRQFGVSETALRQRHRYEVVRCYVLLGGALFAVSFGATGAYFTFGGAPAILAVLMALWFVAGAAQSAFRAWQIRERRLRAFGAWAKTPAAWFPTLFS